MSYILYLLLVTSACLICIYQIYIYSEDGNISYCDIPTFDYRQIEEQYDNALSYISQDEHFHMKLPIITTDRVKVVSFTSYFGYMEDTKTISTRNIWVTLVPELYMVCSLYCDNSNFHMKLKQLLGLHPNSTNTYIVEFEVNTVDIFRPCDNPLVNKQCFDDYYDKHHNNWMIQLRKISYLSGSGYPWTRHGYTYNWGNGKMGLPEFVVRLGSHIHVNLVLDAYSYCCD